MKNTIVLLVFFMVSISSTQSSYSQIFFTGANGKLGVKDANGNILIEPKYDRKNRYKSDKEFTQVAILDKKAGHYKYGYVNSQGKEVIPCIYDFLYSGFDMRVGLAVFDQGDKSGIIDTTGRVIVPAKYHSIWGDFNDGLAVVKLNEKYGYIDANGKEIVPPKYSEVVAFLSGVGIVYQNNKCGMVDTQGKLITPLKYKSLRVVHDGVVRAELNGKFGLLDTSGREITEFKYDDMNLVATEEFISVKFNNKEGYLNMKGEVVIPIIWFIKGKSLVKLNGESFYINKQGQRVSD